VIQVEQLVQFPTMIIIIVFGFSQHHLQIGNKRRVFLVALLLKQGIFPRVIILVIPYSGSNNDTGLNHVNQQGIFQVFFLVIGFLPLTKQGWIHSVQKGARRWAGY
jgi:hypothetical protein